MNKKLLTIISVVVIMLLSYLNIQREEEMKESDRRYYNRIEDENDELRREQSTLEYTLRYYEDTVKKLAQNKEKLSWTYALDESSTEPFENVLFNAYAFSPRAAAQLLLDFKGSVSYHIDYPVIKKDPTIEKDRIYNLLHLNNKKISFVNGKSKTYKSLETMKLNYSIDSTTKEIISVNNVNIKLRLNNYFMEPHTVQTTFEVMTALPAQKVEIKLIKKLTNVDEFFYESEYVRYEMKEQVEEQIIVIEVEN